MVASKSSPGKRHGLARALSKRGLCSRSQAEAWVRAGRVALGGRVVLDPEFPVDLARPFAPVIDGQPTSAVAPVYAMLNKPRGLVTSAADEHGRDTVYRCFDGGGLGWIAPVGRLDKASEGLLLFSNDPAWAARITDPSTGPRKTYHVQVDGLPGDDVLAALVRGIDCDDGHLSAASVSVLRSGDRTAWLEIGLDEGRNRQIRRLLQAVDVRVRRLVRVAIGGLVLGDLAKGAWRLLEAAERDALAPPGRSGELSP